MITEKIGNVEVKRHDDINELVTKNYNLFNEYAVYDAEVGCDLNAVAKHFHKIDYFLANRKVDEALQARKNQHQAFFHIFQKNNFPQLQWACLVQEMDGVPVKDYSIPNLKGIMEKLSEEGLTQAKVLQDVELAKKKSALN